MRGEVSGDEARDEAIAIIYILVELSREYVHVVRSLCGWGYSGESHIRGYTTGPGVIILCDNFKAG